jgi:DNA replication protein DnaC
LPAVRRDDESAAVQARQESASDEAYLLDLVERECESRRQGRVERRLRDSRLFAEKSLSSLDLKRVPAKVAQPVRALLEGRFESRFAHVRILGNPTSGKTHVACALGQELVRSGRKVLFASCSLMVQDLLTAKRDLTLRGFLKKISRYEVVILDNIGYIQHSPTTRSRCKYPKTGRKARFVAVGLARGLRERSRDGAQSRLQRI